MKVRFSTRRRSRDLDAYQSRRTTPHRDSICNAPFVNLYFGVDGQASPCWLYYPPDKPRWSRETSISDIWNSEGFAEVRTALLHNEFVGRCSECEHDIRTGNRPLAAAYDFDHPIGEWPSMLELELSNQCNLACVMCNGNLSSRIRRERDHLPPIDSPYDEAFVDQVAELLPHLHELRFNGGEPFMQPIVHQIAERVGDLRPDLKVTVATNGTVLNSKVERMLERCNVHLNVSIDSLRPGRYEEIRVHSDLELVLDHFETFRQYCAEKDRTLCVMVNPMRVNWDEMVDYVAWCNERDVHLWFNTIREPVHLALHSLETEQLHQIHERLAAQLEGLGAPALGDSDQHRFNHEVFERFVHHVATWRDESVERPAVAPEEVPVTLGTRPG